MAKRKQTAPTGPTLDDLVKLYREKELPADAFDGDLRDAADEEADLIYENVKSDTLREQLEFLYLHGWELGRLKEMIEEYTPDDC